nr:zinc finger MYM-type protein 1-like [Tanacetum cinerariifolium]
MNKHNLNIDENNQNINKDDQNAYVEGDFGEVSGDGNINYEGVDVGNIGANGGDDHIDVIMVLVLRKRPNGIAMISIEHDMLKTIDYKDLIEEFASKNARRMATFTQ